VEVKRQIDQALFRRFAQTYYQDMESVGNAELGVFCSPFYPLISVGNRNF